MYKRASRKDLIARYDKEHVGWASNRKVSAPIVWRGGDKSGPTDRTVPANRWNRCVPGWFDTVFISGEHTENKHFPIIDCFVDDIMRLLVDSSWELEIGINGKITIDAMDKRDFGIENSWILNVFGEVSVYRTKQASIFNKGVLHNEWSLSFNKSKFNQFVYLLQTRSSIFTNLGEVIYL